MDASSREWLKQPNHYLGKISLRTCQIVFFSSYIVNITFGEDRIILIYPLWLAQVKV